jgi:hypothetical protein
VRRLVLAIGASTLLLVSCKATSTNATHPWWYETGVCSEAFHVRAEGNVSAAGDCAGLLSPLPAIVRVHLGGEIDIHITRDESGTLLVPPTFRLSRSGVVVRTKPGLGADVSYRAQRIGHTVLITTPKACWYRTAGQFVHPSVCPALRVIVTV